MISDEKRRSTPKPKFWIPDPAERQSFGRVRQVEWSVSADPEQAVMIRAAKLQHLLAIQVRRHASGRQEVGEVDWSLPAVSERLQTLNYDGLMRVLRGDVHMTLLHAIDLSRVLGRDLLSLRADPARPS